SAYVRTALMKVTPTSGPIAKSSTHQARETRSSRHSLARRTRKGRLCKRKKQVFQSVRTAVSHRAEFVERPFATNAPVAQEHESIANARRVADLMNREHERAALGGVMAQRLGDVARLPEVQAVERFVGEQHRLWRQQAEGQ